MLRKSCAQWFVRRRQRPRRNKKKRKLSHHISAASDLSLDPQGMPTTLSALCEDDDDEDNNEVADDAANHRIDDECCDEGEHGGGEEEEREVDEENDLSDLSDQGAERDPHEDSSDASGPIQLAALNAAENVLPAGRGALNKVVLKRPARSRCPVAQSKGLGAIKMIRATMKAYSLRYGPSTTKWPLVVEALGEGHAQAIESLFEWAQTHKCSKQILVNRRNEMMRAIAKKKPAAAAAGSSLDTDDLPDDQILDNALMSLGMLDDDSLDDSAASACSESPPTWWEEL